MGKTVTDNKTLSISEAAKILGISVATAKNWVRLKKLPCISENPYVFSQKDILGMHKKLDDSEYLKSRRNKTRLSSNYMPRSYIDSSSPNYQMIKSIIRDLEGSDIPIWNIIYIYARLFLKSKDIPAGVCNSLLGDEPSPLPTEIMKEYPLCYCEGEDTLGMLYISLRRLREKKSTGSYYTPFYVVDRIVYETFREGASGKMKVIDPSCGTGNFLLRLPKDLMPENIYGKDIDQMAVAIARINLVLKYNIRTSSTLDTIKSNVSLQDFLKSPKKINFDVVIGNPPWGYVFSKDEYPVIKERFASYSGSKMPESFSLFIEKSLECLSDGAIMSFLLPEAILDVRLHTAIRSLILDKAHICSIDYLGEVFDKVQCPCIILTLKKKGSGEKAGLTEVSFSKANRMQLITKRSFTANSDRLSPSGFQLLCDDDEFALLKRIESAEHFTLRGNATFALGIVTGSNKTLLSDTALPGYERVVMGKDIEKYEIKPAKKYLKFAPESFQQCAPKQCYRANEKLFYRFIADSPVIALDDKGLISLNSANIIIPEVPGYSPSYIMAILNSSVMSFYYRHRFRNMKVLRSALEALPIAKCSQDQRLKLEELVRMKNFAQIDKFVAGLYGFSEKEGLLFQFKVV